MHRQSEKKEAETHNLLGINDLSRPDAAEDSNVTARRSENVRSPHKSGSARRVTSENNGDVDERDLLSAGALF